MSNDNSKTFLDYTGVETLVKNIKDNFIKLGDTYITDDTVEAKIKITGSEVNTNVYSIDGDDTNSSISVDMRGVTLRTNNYTDDATILVENENGITLETSAYDDNGDVLRNALWLTQDGRLLHNDYPVMTENNTNVLKTDETGVVNKSELSIGNFEIKNDKPYSYTLEGKYAPYDWGDGGQPDGEWNAKIVAEYNQEGAKLYDYFPNGGSNIPGGEQWFYEFIVTEALWEKYIGEEDAELEWVECPKLIGTRLLILAAYLDSDYYVGGIEKLTFTDGKSTILNNTTADDYNECQLYDVVFTQSAPFSLRHTSKALLNGSPVITAETLASSDIVSGLNKNITNEVNRAVAKENELLSKINTNTTAISGKVDKSDIVIGKGEVDNSAVLKGEYKVGTTTYLNKALSKVSVSVGAGSTAGLKGWYYSAITFGTNPVITLSDSQPYVLLNVLRGGSWSSGTPNINVGDKISIVNDAKYDYCGEVKSISGNKITLKEALPFDSLAVSLISSNDPDDWTIYLPERANAGIIDFGGGSLAEGVNTQATNIGAHAEGIQSHAYGQYSHTEGFQTKAGYSAHAEGKNTTATGDNSHAEGQNTAANGNNSHAEGQNTIATGKAAHAEGYNTVTGYTLDGTTYSGANSHAEGESTIAARGSHAEGVNTIAYGWQSHAEGKETIAHGSFSHTEGLSSIAAGSAAHAEGNQTKALGNAAHAEGYMTEAAELYAHAEGNETKATGKYSHTEGYKTEATTNNAHAEGNQTKAQGNSAHAEGKLTVAAKDFSHAGGLSSIASGIGSFAHGNYVTATKDYEVAFGKFNVSNEDTIFSIGNGTDENSRSNILEIKHISSETTVNYQVPKTSIFFSADVILQSVIDNTTVLVITYVSTNNDYAIYRITYVNESNYTIQGNEQYIRRYDSTEHLILSVGDLLYVPLEKPMWESEYDDDDSEDKIIGYENNRCMYIDTLFTKNNAIRILDGNWNPGLVQLIESAPSTLFVNNRRVLIENDEYINSTKSEILAESKAYTDNTNSEILAESKAYTDNKFNNIDVDNNLPLQATANGGIITINDDRVASNVASGKSSFAMGGYVADSGNKYDGCNAIGAASFSGGVDNYSNGICSFTYGFGLKTTTASQKYGETALGKYNKSTTDTIFSVGFGSSDTNRKNVFEIKTTGSVYASSFYETSDERIKIFTKPIETDLDKLSALRKSYFTYIEAPGTTQIGVSAQEVQKLYPEIVTENSNGLLTVDYSKLSVIALNAIDDLHKKNKELEDRLARLESIVKNIL